MPPKPRKSEKVTRKQWLSRVEQIERLAEIKGARFEADTPEKQLARKAEAVVLPEAFNRYYLPHYFRESPASFHLEMYRALEEERRIVVRAPRGHAKSTVMTFAYTLHQVVCAPILRAWEDGTLEAVDPAFYKAICAAMERLGRGVRLHWDPYIQIVSATTEQAVEFTAGIKLELLDNELLRSDWGVGMTDERQADGDWVSASGVRVKAFGMTKAIRGGRYRQWRPTLCILDDPDSEETVGTLRLREKQTKKVTAGIGYGLEPRKSRMILLGTPVHPDCLVCRFTAPEKFQRWKKLRYKAICDDGLPLWAARWAADGDPVKALEALQEAEDEDPEAFAMEMMDTPPSTGKPFHTLHYYKRAEYADLSLPKILIFDPALGESDTSDYQAVVVLRGPTAEGYILWHRVELLRIGDPAELTAKVGSIYDEEQPDLALIEAIGFQRLLTFMLSAQSRKAQTFQGWEQVTVQKQSKDMRIRGTSSLYNQGIVRFPDDRSCRSAELQALDYPDGKRDALDAAEMGIRRTRAKLRRTGGIRHGQRERAHIDPPARVPHQTKQESRRSRQRRW